MSDHRVCLDYSRLSYLEQCSRFLSLNVKFRPSGLFSGQHRSLLRGTGLSFEELKPYQQGDSVKNIDWKCSQRSQKLISKVYTQETDRPAIILCDQRVELFFGSEQYMKSVIAAELAIMMGYLFKAQGDRVGGGVLATDSNAFFPSTRASSSFNAWLSELVKSNQSLSSSALGVDKKTGSRTKDHLKLIDDAIQTLGMSGTFVFVTDGLNLSDELLAKLKQNAHRHNIILFLINDPLELDYQQAVGLAITDGQKQVMLDENRDDLILYRQAIDKRLADIKKELNFSAFPVIEFNTTESSYLQLSKLLGGAYA
ncbi:DUF58 domain-containing protein [Vibrio sp. SS-MA-C1-2]|uniref:DUF58 domain-containing protein n=1 Tax=Vibrio sp. SS-MA-C1-2 TaxID=2908646 RepID=UPI001F3BD6A1|nr:DUF58 domain-containing protein [Vibrio sp. SS-MA-C1-2]UJF18065.1 DUF58 domain-containing protein [Vibrio sp. SS-MA-C1-2]